ncbi:MAG: hypothetical protein AAF220_07530 [Pseudomonadota bacterium]
MRLFIIILFGLLLLLGGLVGAYFALDLRDEFQQVQDAVGINLTSSEEASPIPNYVTMERMRIPVFRGQRVIRHVTFQVVMAADLARDATLLEGSKHILADAYLRELTSYVNLQYDETRLLAREDDEVLAKRSAKNLENIKKRLRLIGNRLMGEGVIDEILMTEYLERRPSG